MDQNIYEIEGSGGKGGGGGASRPPIEANDTLQSKQTVKILLAVSEGEIDSVEEVYLNRVPISSFDATYEVRTGTTNQIAIPGFIDAEAPLGTFNSSEITTLIPGGPYAIDTLADAVRITLNVPALSRYKDNGDLVGTEVELDIYTSIDNSNWIYYTTTRKSGKASGQYAWDVQVNKPNNAIPNNPWYIKVLRITADSTTQRLSNKTFIAAIIQLYYANLTYSGTALVGITLRNAEQFGGQIPEVTIKGKFLKVKIPNNYNPITREYTGNWNLGFHPVKQFTSNISWVIFYCLNDVKALNIPEFDIDKASFYSLSKYADELIPDGFGGFIPRYHIGFQFIQRENVPGFLANLLSLCNANLATNEFGQISIIFDAPGQQPSKIITNANVIDGLFNYSSNDLEGRTTQVNVTYNDFNRFGSSSTATIPSSTPTTFEQGLIDRYGLQVSDIVLLGCRYEAQAIHKARWALYTNSMTTKFVSFKVMLQGLTFYYGELLKILDSENQQVMQHSVIVDYTFSTGNTILTLDRDLFLSNDSWSVNFTSIDGITIYEKTILESDVTTNTITFAGEITPFINSVIILNGPVEGKLYKVTGVQKDDDYYVIAAVEHDENKYTYINDGISLSTPGKDFVDFSSFVSEPVSNLVAYPVSYSDTTTSNIQLRVKWDWDLNLSETYKASFIANWRRDNQDFQNVTDIQGQSFDIDKAIPGVYDINVWAINPSTGIKSTVQTLVYNYKTSVSTSTLLPPVNARITGTAGLEYSSREMSLSFDYNSLNADISEDALHDYIAELWDTGGTTLYKTTTVLPDSNKNGLLKISLEDNIASFGTPTREYRIKLFSRDLSGELSTPLSIVVNNAVPALPDQVNVTSGIGVTYLNIFPPNENDIVGYRVWRGTTSDFTPSSFNLVYDGPDTLPSIEADPSLAITYYFKIACYDTFGKTNLNITPSYSTTTLTGEIDYWTFDGLIFKQNDPSTNFVSWTSGAANKNGTLVSNISSGQTEWSSGILYIYYPGSGSTLSYSTDLTIAVSGTLILATYRGGTDLTVGNGKAYIDGGLVLANTVGANQLVANSAIITNTAQLANAIINNTHIQDAAISNAKIQDAAITNAKIQNATIQGAKIASATITDANIANAAIKTAKIDDLQVTTMKIGNNSITVHNSAFTQAVFTTGGTGWYNVQSATMSVSYTAAILVYGSFSFKYTVGVSMRILRNGVDITGEMPSMAGVAMIRDVVGAGTYTYTLQAKVSYDTGSGFDISHRMVTLFASYR